MADKNPNPKDGKQPDNVQHIVIDKMPSGGSKFLKNLPILFSSISIFISSYALWYTIQNYKLNNRPYVFLDRFSIQEKDSIPLMFLSDKNFPARVSNVRCGIYAQKDTVSKGDTLLYSKFKDFLIYPSDNHKKLYFGKIFWEKVGPHLDKHLYGRRILFELSFDYTDLAREHRYFYKVQSEYSSFRNAFVNPMADGN